MLPSPNRMAEIESLEDFRLPTFGSPPNKFVKLLELASAGAVLGTTGVLVNQGEEVLVLLATSGTFVVWFTKPAAKVLRRRLAERVAEAVGTTMKPEDEE